MAEVVIRDPDPDWAGEFERVAAELGALLGDGGRRIDHIGSTAVPALASRDVIDVQVTVGDEAGLVTAADRLAAGGWRVRPGFVADHAAPGAPEAEGEWVKRFAAEPEGHRRVNVHVRIAGRANHRYALLFRDYLRAHPATAAAYGTFKRRAAELLSDSLFSYVELKDPVCDLIYLPAEEWAARTGWTPGAGQLSPMS
jgi:GrpB-like predicted nucleotidyltransferase (UPF0157 family)